MPITAGNKKAYLRLRIAVGTLGMSLPLVLLGGGGLFDGVWGQTSISEYHYSAMRDYFDATLGTIGLFLFYYPGYDRWDRAARWLAGIGAWGVAIIYTTRDGPGPCAEMASSKPDLCSLSLASLVDAYRADIHLLFASIFFAGLVLFCFLFRKPCREASFDPVSYKASSRIKFLPDWMRWFMFAGYGLYENKNSTFKNKNMFRNKLYKNRVFLICGGGMILCLVAIVIFDVFHICARLCDAASCPWIIAHWVYISESIAIILFGFAWFIKGEGHRWIRKLRRRWWHRICQA